MLERNAVEKAIELAVAEENRAARRLKLKSHALFAVAGLSGIAGIVVPNWTAKVVILTVGVLFIAQLSFKEPVE